MAKPNVLFILADQWRHECLSGAGHPVVKTPNLDRLAAQGARFEHAYVQSPVCGPSRVCFFTGRYMHAHRHQWNGVAIASDERGMGDLLREGGYEAALCGKGSGVRGDLGLIAVPMNYTAFLNEHGYEGADAAQRYAGCVETPSGELIDTWDFESLPYPLRVKAEHGPEAYVTHRAIDTMERLKADEGGKPWALHVSYIWPHWPLGAPEPYHGMYSPDAVPAPVRDESELSAHPLLEPFRVERRSVPMDNEWVWRHARAVYYAMMSAVDAEVGKLLDYLQRSGQLDNTLIVFSSDHGEYLGDHWMFEKELFYDQAVRVPLIVRCPGAAYDATRGRVLPAFAEAVDVLPTLLDAAGLALPPGLGGRSLLPLLRGESPAWRDCAVCEWDYEFYECRAAVNTPPDQCYGIMLRTREYKYIHYAALPCQLFDLARDPDELRDVSRDPAYAGALSDMRARTLDFMMRSQDRTYSGAMYDRVGMVGVHLQSDATANYGAWTRAYTPGR